MEYLRDAVESDVDLLYQWANEKSVRENSFSTCEISYDNHVKWFENILESDHVRQFIYMQDDKPAGQVRITIDGQEAEIGYSICKEKRQKGLGKKMLALLSQKIEQDYPCIKKLTAKVKPGNIASQKVFEDMEYELKFYGFEKEIDRNGMNKPE